MRSNLKLTTTAGLIIILVCINQLSYGEERLTVATTFYPVAHFTEQVGGPNVRVINVTPAGAEPHEYEPSPRDMQKIWSSDVFIFHGAGLDRWANKIRADLEKNGGIVLELTRNFELLRGHNGSDFDPHIWLDPKLADRSAKVIRDALIKADPEMKNLYNENYTAFSLKLDQLDRKFREGLSSCKSRTIVVSHDAFSYLARAYDLEALAVSGISPEEEPSPRKMAEIVKVVKKKGIKYIFFETLVSPRIARTIAEESSAETIVLNSLGGLTKDELKRGETYISVMEDNLKNLRRALSCR